MKNDIIPKTLLDAARACDAEIWDTSGSWGFSCDIDAPSNMLWRATGGKTLCVVVSPGWSKKQAVRDAIKRISMGLEEQL